jgi:hypothetical protein
VTPVNVRDADEIERVLAAFARAPGGGLIVTGIQYRCTKYGHDVWSWMRHISARSDDTFWNK